MTDAAPLSLPLSPTFRLFSDGIEQPSPCSDSKAEIYKSLLGSLVYASICTRPDIATAVSILFVSRMLPTLLISQLSKAFYAISKALRTSVSPMVCLALMSPSAATRTRTGRALPTLNSAALLPASSSQWAALRLAGTASYNKPQSCRRLRLSTWLSRSRLFVSLSIFAS
eukprot:scaffold45289_cov22-Prasinocladus_malaysianus.AAC.1